MADDDNEVTEEVAEETADSGADAGNASVDDAIENEVILEGITFEPASKTAGKKAADDKPEEKADSKEPTEIEKRMAEVEKNYASASQHIKDLQIALHKTRQENKALKESKPSKADEEFLTDEQVKAILKEHEGDYDTILRVINHQAAKAAAKAGKEVKNDVETRQVQQKLTGYLEAEWPDAIKEDSEIRPHIEKAKAELGIENSPYADFLAAGAHFLLNWRPAADKIVKDTEERVRKELLGDKAEATRKAVVKNTSLAAKGAADKKPATTKPSNIDAIAKQLNMNARERKIYAQLIGKRSVNAQMGA